MTSLGKRLIDVSFVGACESDGSRCPYPSCNCTDDVIADQRSRSRDSLLAALRALQDAGPSEGMIAAIMGQETSIQAHILAVHLWDSGLRALISEIEATDAA